MSTRRKKWSTSTVPTLQRRRHESKAAAYRYTQSLAAQFAAGMLRPDLTRVTVWVDEGRGWQVYETLRLADLASPSAVGGERSDNPSPDLGGAA